MCIGHLIKGSYRERYSGSKQIVRKVMSHSIKLCYQNLGPRECLKFVTFTDAAYANLIDGGSQEAYFIFLVGENEARNLISWQSWRIKRIIKSTLAAETLAFGGGIDATVYVSSLFTEIYYGTSDVKRIPIEAVIDNQSLYDALKSTQCVSDEQLKVDIGAVKEMLCSREIMKVHWVDTKKQLADILTRKGVSPLPLLTVFSESHLPDF